MSKISIAQPVDFGSAIKKAQEGSYIRVSDIAKKMGVAPQQVSRWQKAKDIKLSRAVQIAQVFEMTLPEFLDAYHE